MLAEKLKDRWQVVKNGVPVGIYDTPEEADDAYLEFDADWIQAVPPEEEP